MKAISGAVAYAQLIANTRAHIVRIPAKDEARFPEEGGIFPPLQPKFEIRPGQMIFTIGSCFARNIEAVLVSYGLEVPVAQFALPAVELPRPPTHILNEYNAGTMIQRIESTCGLFTYNDEMGIEEVAGGYIDLFLHIDAKPVTMERLIARRREIARLYEALPQADMVILTLGLVESWFDTKHQCYLNRAPSRKFVAANPGRFEFHRMDIDDVQMRMSRAIDLIFKMGTARVLLTVSPVPIEATFMPEGAVVANSYSKAVLRICADLLSSGQERVDYFPSYEIVTSFGTQGYRDDNVHVRNEIVGLVTRYMVEHYAQSIKPPTERDLYDQFFEKLRRGDVVGARDLALNLHRIAPGSWMTQDALGQYFLSVGAYPAALESALRAMQFAGSNDAMFQGRVDTIKAAMAASAQNPPAEATAVAVEKTAAAKRPPARAKRDLKDLPAHCDDSAALSVIVQGPCTRERHGGEGPSIDVAIDSIRTHFPKAQIIVSTWAGSDVEGLDADNIILNADPGALEHPRQRPSNFNRMVVSTTAGLAAADRPFAIKTRNDVIFESSALLGCHFSPAMPELSLAQRIWVAAFGTARLDTYLRPLHPCDMVQFGATDDLRRLWDRRRLTWQDVFLDDPQATVPRMCPEQALFIEYLRDNGIEIEIETTIDGREPVVGLSIEMMLGAFDVFDEEALGVRFPLRLTATRYPHLRETAHSFAALRQAWMQDKAAIRAATFAAFHERMRRLVAREITLIDPPDTGLAA